jgi:hypothetical protein
MSVPQVVESYDDGTYMWQRGKEFACSWDGPFAVGNNSQDRIPRVVTPWFPTIAAARLAWEIAKPVRKVDGFGMAKEKREGATVRYD